MRERTGRWKNASVAHAEMAYGLLRDESADAAPECSEAVRCAGLQRQHGVVAGTRVVDVRVLRHEKAKVHDVLRASGRTRNVGRGQTRRPAHHGRREVRATRLP